MLPASHYDKEESQTEESVDKSKKYSNFQEF